MVFFINPYHLFSGSVYSKARGKMNVMKEVEQAPNNDNVPVPNDNQEIVNMGEVKMTALSDDSMNDINEIQGSGFTVKGAGIRKTRNEKLKKFITLNI